MSGLGRNFRGAIERVLASVLLLISAIWLPWATYRSPTLDVTFKSGHFGWILVFCGLGSLGLVGVSLFRNRPIDLLLHLLLGCGALICSVANALAKIADANHTTSGRPGYAATTSFGIGAILAIASSIAIVVSIAAQRARKASDRTGKPMNSSATSAR